MGIDVIMSRKEAKKITPKTPVAIYPEGSTKPVEIVNDMISLTDKGIRFRVVNLENAPPISKKTGYKLNIVTCGPIAVLGAVYPLNQYLSVPTESLCKDEQGTFV